MKVLITGANGFVGRNLVAHFGERKADEVVCFTRDNSVNDLPALDSMNEFSRIIEMMANFDEGKRSLMRTACIKYAHDISEDNVTLEMNRGLFQAAINNQIKPVKK